MPRVKIIWSNHISINYGEDDIDIWAGPVSGWEELTDAELDVLRQNLHYLRHRPDGGFNYRAHLLIDDPSTSTRTYLEQAVELRRLDD